VTLGYGVLTHDEAVAWPLIVANAIAVRRGISRKVDSSESTTSFARDNQRLSRVHHRRRGARRATRTSASGYGFDAGS